MLYRNNGICDVTLRGACWMQAVDALRASAEGWWAVALSPLITQAREFHILHKLKSFPVPSLLPPDFCPQGLPTQKLRTLPLPTHGLAAAI